ncbi:MAG: hypothetical protein KatS3mg026_1220 [Bacteroidia bacterium]|nr:MAG: hypothetical protein KatS3mg026_1220 [Bacteroidia bacterium]
MAVYEVLVSVLPRPVLLDPEGETIGRALRRQGHLAVQGVRAGRAFLLRLEAHDAEAALSLAHEVARTLLYNPVVETYTIHPPQPVQPT